VPSYSCKSVVMRFQLTPWPDSVRASRRRVRRRRHLRSNRGRPPAGSNSALQTAFRELGALRVLLSSPEGAVQPVKTREKQSRLRSGAMRLDATNSPQKASEGAENDEALRRQPSISANRPGVAFSILGLRDRDFRHGSDRPRYRPLARIWLRRDAKFS
jgi:hypothetical protein